ncbi:MFS transporter [Nocardiopsis ansamitocini]|uniref:MFS transporter n=1 Tax=Nocardiopsis ansamitocini TaxID=1670832 RepID=A0A9W6UJF7_9ACTN|nr:MFS transporter [Nocardiopsis ansamitocini]GLU48677.1 MFS transporter [Nocardiopsis ansamitocini]
MPQTVTAPLHRRKAGQAVVLVLVGTLTVMAGATVAPAIPGIQRTFGDAADVELMARMVTTTHALAIVLFSPFSGFVVERVSARNGLMLGLLAFSIGGSSGFYLPTLPTILIGRAVLGIGVSLVLTSGMTMIADLYEGVKRQRLLGWQTAAGAFGGAVLLLGGGALAALDWRVVFLVYLLGIAYIVPVLIYLPRPRRKAETSLTPGNTSESVERQTKKVPSTVAAALVAMLLGQIAFYSVPVQVPFLVENDFGASSIVSGAVIAAQTFTTGMVSTRFAFFRRFAAESGLVALSFLGIGVGYLVLFLAQNALVLTAGLVIMGTGLGILIPNLNNWVMGEAAPRMRARYASLLTTSLFLGQFLAPIVTQPVVEAIGVQHLFAVVATGALVVAVVYFIAGRPLGRTPSHRTRSAAFDRPEKCERAGPTG